MMPFIQTHNEREKIYIIDSRHYRIDDAEVLQCDIQMAQGLWW